jgi:hypothetical protein
MNAFTHNPRGSMTPQRRARIFASRHGICGDADLGAKNWGCGRRLRPPRDKWTVEHHPALENGGMDIDEQCYVICENCLALKNADDHGEAAYSREVYTNFVVPKKFRQKQKRGWK